MSKGMNTNNALRFFSSATPQTSHNEIKPAAISALGFGWVYFVFLMANSSTRANGRDDGDLVTFLNHQSTFTVATGHIDIIEIDSHEA